MFDHGYWWLAHAWENFFYACHACNGYKKTQSPLGAGSVPLAAEQAQPGRERPLLTDPAPVNGMQQPLREQAAQKEGAPARARRGPARRQAQKQQTLVRATRALEWVELLTPRQIADEQVGDALEVIHRLVAMGRPSWHIYLKVAATIFWVLYNALHPSSRSAAMKKRAR